MLGGMHKVNKRPPTPEATEDPLENAVKIAGLSHKHKREKKHEHKHKHKHGRKSSDEDDLEGLDLEGIIPAGPGRSSVVHLGKIVRRTAAPSRGLH